MKEESATIAISPIVARVNQLLLARAGVEAEVVSIPPKIEAAAATLAELEASVDLQSEAALDAVARQQTLVSLLPRRLAAKEAELDKLDADLLAACHDLVSKELAPRGRKLESIVRAKGTAEFAGQFRTEAELNAAVAMSAKVREVSDLCAGLTLDPQPFGGAAKYASRLSAQRQQLTALESKWL